MNGTLFRLIAAILLLLGLPPPRADAAVVVVGNDALVLPRKIDRNTLGRIYTGRTVQLDGIALHPIHMKSGHGTRDTFVRAVLQQKDDDHVAYWIVRRAIGKGAPPPEVESTQEMIRAIRATPGAIGYLDDKEVDPSMNVLHILQ